MFTLFSRKAAASAFAPLGPILLCSRLTVVSVYDRKLKIGTRNTKQKIRDGQLQLRSWS
jgi:hypothetical protein